MRKSARGNHALLTASWCGLAASWFVAGCTGACPDTGCPDPIMVSASCHPMGRCRVDGVPILCDGTCTVARGEVLTISIADIANQLGNTRELVVQYMGSALQEPLPEEMNAVVELDAVRGIPIRPFDPLPVHMVFDPFPAEPKMLMLSYSDGQALGAAEVSLLFTDLGCNATHRVDCAE